MVILASSFDGMFGSLAAITGLMSLLALASLVPAARGRWWTWLLLVLPLLIGICLAGFVVLYSDQLPLALNIAFPLPLIISVASIAIWLLRRRRR
ncbi:MAG TPA: Loki-CTERM sorting domain-containing protein [Candidatus Acidoferrales bacterium]|jgi:hypothetical protein|nr:Loki-CTERM sorting domain-containing protein [Candidatus Acidoferrales bacterium]